MGDDQPWQEPDDAPEADDRPQDDPEDHSDHLADDLPDIEDDDVEDEPDGRWRPTWALVLAVSFATLQVLGVVAGLAFVVFDLLHDSDTYDGLAAGIGAYLVVVFSLTSATWAYYLARPTLRAFVVAVAALVGVPAVGYLFLRLVN